MAAGSQVKSCDGVLITAWAETRLASERAEAAKAVVVNFICAQVEKTRRRGQGEANECQRKGGGTRVDRVEGDRGEKRRGRGRERVARVREGCRACRLTVRGDRRGAARAGDGQRVLRNGGGRMVRPCTSRAKACEGRALQGE